MNFLRNSTAGLPAAPMAAAQGPIPTACPEPTHVSHDGPPPQSQDVFQPGVSPDELQQRQQQLRDLARRQGLHNLNPLDQRRYLQMAHRQDPASVVRRARANDATVAPQRHVPGAVEVAQRYYQQQINQDNPYASIPQSLINLSGMPQAEGSLQKSG
ncbi:MAG: hypothetical protein ACYCW6_10540, partial [Candidatus Xenobia bacterium]